MLTLRVGARTGRGGTGGAVGDPEFDRNVEVLRAGYAAFAGGDFGGVVALLDPRFVVEVHTLRPDLPETPLYHGPEGFLQNWREVTEPFDDMDIEVEAIGGTSERMIVTARMTGRGRASGVPLDQHIFHAWTVRDGKALRLDIYSSMKETLAGG